MVQPTIDTAIFDDLKETAGAEFVGELVDTFLVEAPVMLRDLRSALATGNADAFRRAAHSLKSNCNTFGALTLAAKGEGARADRTRRRPRREGRHARRRGNRNMRAWRRR